MSCPRACAPRLSTFTFLGEFTGTGGSVPFVVLGPTTMTGIEYSTTPSLEIAKGKITRGRDGITPVTAVDGAAAGEIADPSTTLAAAKLGMFIAFRAEIAGKYVDVDPLGGATVALPVNAPDGPAQRAIRTAVAEQGEHAGLVMTTDSAGGDAVPDNVSEVLTDLATFDAVPVSSIHYTIDWIGKETSRWNAAVLDVDAPGLPKVQIFVRGLAFGAPDSASPGMNNSFVRPAVELTPGHVPTTAGAFGGTPEPNVFGYGSATVW